MGNITSRVVKIETCGNKDIGYLSFFEASRNIPFDIKRVYYIYGVPTNVRRGMHAHKTLKQALWCPHGVIEITTDDGEMKTNYILDSPDKVLLLVKGYWREMYWKKEGSVLCVAASDYYNEADYIRDYDEYIRYIKEHGWNDED